MPVILNDEEIQKKVTQLVDKGWENDPIEKELLEEGLEKQRVTIWLDFAANYRKLKKKRESAGQIILGILLLLAAGIIALVLKNDNFYLEGTLLVLALHQLIEGIIRFNRLS